MSPKQLKMLEITGFDDILSSCVMQDLKNQLYENLYCFFLNFYGRDFFTSLFARSAELQCCIENLRKPVVQFSKNVQRVRLSIFKKISSVKVKFLLVKSEMADYSRRNFQISV